jgi:phosphopantetheinyl transferase
MGSGQTLADPLLGFIRTTFWENNAPPSHQEGIFAAAMVLKQSIAMATGGIAEPIQMAVLRSRKGQLQAHRLGKDELSEHEQSVDDAIEHFREYREKLRGKDTETKVIEPPIPPSSDN